MKLKQSALGVALVLFAGAATAASVDFRQEYKHEQESYASRFKVSGGVGNVYFGVEAKQNGNIFEDWRSGDNEFEIGYKYKINDKLYLQPGMPVTFSSTNVTYKPQIRVGYKFDSGLVAKFRYRHEFRYYQEGSSTTGRDGNKYSSVNKSKLTANLDYKWNYWQFGLEGNYTEDFFNEIYKTGQNGQYDWDYNLKIGYKGKDWAWRPYVEFGNVNCSSSCSEDATRQLRSRVGITYSF
ncbi:oligogalacturonate-specific porin KdgM family protein [Vibrio variabilis]|uniref:oligogalacturonate-specific porin KdgM family protein n=1 Tax=Vibrio variabilis TaxID=990271 RepID=UPI000DD53061|nr:oligogalacturonate-specific porin KdgM family protein [Vibrio variabilis]